MPPTWPPPSPSSPVLPAPSTPTFSLLPPWFTRELPLPSSPLRRRLSHAPLSPRSDAAGASRTLQGVNTETCILSSCICAERAALAQLRLAPGGWRWVDAVYIAATSPTLVTPGLLCREFLSEFSPAVAARREALLGGGGGGAGAAALPAVTLPPADPDGDIAIVLFSSDQTLSARYRLLELYPYAPLYHGVPHAQLADRGAAFAARCAPVTEGALAALAAGAPHLAPLLHAAVALHAAVLALAAKPHDGDALYPVHLAAGALLSTGGVALARQLKGLEYGCSADAVVRLSGRFCVGGVGAGEGLGEPLLLLQVDQFGTCLARRDFLGVRSAVFYDWHFFNLCDHAPAPPLPPPHEFLLQAENRLPVTHFR